MKPIRELERESIKAFLVANESKLRGRVLDIGCGLQPYRSIIEGAKGTYIGYDRAGHAGSVVQEDVGDYWDLIDEVDAVMMTQVWQYISIGSLCEMLERLASGDWSLKRGGWFLATGPTNWPLVEADDLHRFTPAGAKSILASSGFQDIHVEERARIEVGGERWPLGWQAVAQARL